MWIWQNGADLVDPATRQVRLDEPAVIEALDAYGGLIHRDRICPPLSVVSSRGFFELFRAGRVAMFMGGAADDLDRLKGHNVAVAEVPSGPTGIRATFAWTAGLHISADVLDPAIVFDAWTAVLDGIQRWKIPAPRRELAALLESFEPRKAGSAPVIRASMNYMRTPTLMREQARWISLFADQFLDKLLREGTPAGELVEQTRSRLGNWQ